MSNNASMGSETAVEALTSIYEEESGIPVQHTGTCDLYTVRASSCVSISPSYGESMCLIYLKLHDCSIWFTRT